MGIDLRCFVSPFTIRMLSSSWISTFFCKFHRTIPFVLKRCIPFVPVQGQASVSLIFGSFLALVIYSIRTKKTIHGHGKERIYSSSKILCLLQSHINHPIEANRRIVKTAILQMRRRQLFSEAAVRKGTDKFKSISLTIRMLCLCLLSS